MLGEGTLAFGGDVKALASPRLIRALWVETLTVARSLSMALSTPYRLIT